jgi:hypothetical protein
VGYYEENARKTEPGPRPRTARLLANTKGRDRPFAGF